MGIELPAFVTGATDTVISKRNADIAALDVDGDATIGQRRRSRRLASRTPDVNAVFEPRRGETY